LLFFIYLFYFLFFILKMWVLGYCVPFLLGFFFF